MGFGRGVEGGPMLSYPSLEVNGATRVGALRLPLEVYLLLGLGVVVGHLLSQKSGPLLRLLILNRFLKNT